MQVLPAKRREENIAGKYSREIIWESNGEYPVNICESNIL